MLTTSSELRVPAGNESKSDLVIDLSSIQHLEARQSEVATVTRAKAGELLSVYNKAWLDLHNLLARLEAEKNQAQRAVDQRKGVLILEVIPDKLKSLGISSAADTRTAVIDTDEEYRRLVDRLDQIEAVVMLLKGKAKSFENAYTSVKKIMGDDAFNMKSGPSLSGDTRSPANTSLVRAGAPSTPTTTKPARAGFGNPKD